MSKILIKSCFLFSLCTVLSLCGFNSLHAQEGFEKLAKSITEGTELTDQPHLSIMEVHMKPVRLVWVEFKDYNTGKMKKEPVYYICYRATNRPLKERPVKPTTPVNQLDPINLPDYFIPILTLVAKDGDKTTVHMDQILPEAQKLINENEKRVYKNSVEATAPFPEATNDPANDSNSIYGVAMFRGVNMDVDHFSIFLRGFSNGYKLEDGPEGKPLKSRKTIQQDFWRPGDRYDPELFRGEVRFVGDPKWLYRPE